MKKVVAVLLVVMVGITLSGLRAESTEQVTGGCQAQMGELSQENAARIDEIAALIETGEDMKMLSNLYDFLQEDPANKQLARPIIQRILTAVSQKQLDVQFDLTSWREGDSQKVTGLIDYYIIDVKMYPEFSYEASICWELSVILWDKWSKALREAGAEKSTSTNTMVRLQEDIRNGERYIEQLKQLPANKLNSTRDGAAALWDAGRPLDVCARKQLWEYAERLLGGGPYWPQGGIERLPDTVTGLKAAYENEQHEVIREIAGRVISKIEAMEN